MIYDKITETINNYLGGDYVLTYANNYDVEWDKILPEVQNELKYGVVRVDSGTTQQVGGQTIRVEQVSLKVAIPEDREIFSQAVANLRSMLDGLNRYQVVDTEETALLYFGNYQDANGTAVNGSMWWIATITFIVNIYDGVINSDDSEIKINGTTLSGVIDSNFTLDKTVDGFVFNDNIEQKNAVNGIRKILTINLVYLKNDALIHDATNHTGILDNEESISTTYTITYDNGVITRTLTDMMLTNVNEKIITGNVLNATLIFTKGA